MKLNTYSNAQVSADGEHIQDESPCKSGTTYANSFLIWVWSIGEDDTRNTTVPMEITITIKMRCTKLYIANKILNRIIKKNFWLSNANRMNLIRKKNKIKFPEFCSAIIGKRLSVCNCINSVWGVFFKADNWLYFFYEFFFIKIKLFRGNENDSFYEKLGLRVE